LREQLVDGPEEVDLRFSHSRTTPNLSSRAVALAFVVGAHVALILIVSRHSLVVTKKPRGVEPLTVISLSTSSHTVRLSTPIVPSVLPAIEIGQPLLVLVDGANQTGPSAQGNGQITPPAPTDAFVDTSPFVKQAGLQKGSGVTVVLRVEVRGSGEVARVAVEVSGGAPEVDQAAIAYVRAMKWTGGLKDDKPETLWIRWGVRFDG
jgi:TonB family protein